jgi:hypothetical protein
VVPINTLPSRIRYTCLINGTLLLAQVRQRAAVIETEYVSAAQSRYLSARLKLNEIQIKVSDTNNEIIKLIRNNIMTYHKNSNIPSSASSGSYSRLWWNSILPTACNNSTFLYHLQTHIDLGGEAYIKLKYFREVSGLAFLLDQEYDTLKNVREQAKKSVGLLPNQPSKEEIEEGSDCSKCRGMFTLIYIYIFIYLHCYLNIIGLFNIVDKVKNRLYNNIIIIIKLDN